MCIKCQKSFSREVHFISLFHYTNVLAIKQCTYTVTMIKVILVYNLFIVHFVSAMFCSKYITRPNICYENRISLNKFVYFKPNYVTHDYKGWNKYHHFTQPTRSDTNRRITMQHTIVFIFTYSTWRLFP